MNKFLKLPVYFSSGDPDDLARQREEAKTLGIEFNPPKEKGEMYVAVDRIRTFNRDSKGRTTIEMDDGYRQGVMMKFKDFLELLKEADCEVVE